MRAGLESGDLVVDVGDLAGDLSGRSVEAGEQRVAVFEQREEAVTLRGELSLELLRRRRVATDRRLLGDDRVVGRGKTLDEVENLL